MIQFQGSPLGSDSKTHSLLLKVHIGGYCHGMRLSDMTHGPLPAMPKVTG